MAGEVQQPGVPVARQRPGQWLQGGPRDLGHESVVAPVMVTEIAPVAAEELVPAHAGEDHGDVPSREFRHQVRRDEGGIRDRLVHVPQESREQARHVRLDDDLVVVRAEPLGHPSSPG